MYNKTKYMIYISALILIFAIIILTSILSSRPSIKNKEQDTPPTSSHQQDNKLKLPENSEMRVSEDLRSYVYPESDPLKEFDEEQNNSNTLSAPPNEENRITEIQTIEPQETKIKQNAKPAVRNKTLYNQDKTKTENYEVSADFKLGTTNFYVIAYKGDEIQNDSEFINKKYYIYKDKNGTLTRCFYLFDREQRKSDLNRNFITVSTDNERTTIDFNGINKVSRRIFNSQLLGPYGESAEEPLHFEEKTHENTSSQTDSSIPVMQ